VDVDADGVRASTGPDGIARLELPSRPDGLHRIPVRAAGRDAVAVVRILPADSPVFISDIDETIADVSPLGFIVKPSSWVPPMPGAAEALEAIGRAFPLVYLTARDHVFTRKTRGWLAMNRFPEAPILTRKGTRFTTVRAKDHKILRLAELKRDFPRIAWGIGDKRGDAEAYASAGIPAICFAARRPEGVPESVPCCASWDEVRRFVKA
jgi:hypothetical protein